MTKSGIKRFFVHHDDMLPCANSKFKLNFRFETEVYACLSPSFSLLHGIDRDVVLAREDSPHTLYETDEESGNIIDPEKEAVVLVQ